MDKDVYQLFLETLKKYGEPQLSSAIYLGITDSDFRRFTNTNRSRERFLEACEENYINESDSKKGTHRLLKNYVKLALSTMLSDTHEYDNFNTNTALNYAIISTYKDQYKRTGSSQKALYETTRILENLVQNGINNFSTKADGNSSPFVEINNMLKAVNKNRISPKSYFSSLIATQFTDFMSHELDKTTKKYVMSRETQRNSRDNDRPAKESPSRESRQEPIIRDENKPSGLFVKKLFNRGFKKFKSKVLNGQISELQSCDSIDRNLHVAQVKGNRNTQEDSCLICKSEAFPDLNFMVVCDGMGGFEAGELASQLAVTELQRWFQANERLLADVRTPDQLNPILNNKLQEISNRIRTLGRQSGCTCVCAMTNANGTFISNVGDSRAYAISNNGNTINQVTRDQSYVAEIWGAQHPQVSWDDYRFHKKSNEIMQYLGMDPIEDGMVSPDSYYLPPHSFEKLILCSDGVSDIMGRGDILAVNRTSNPKLLAQNLVQYTLTHDALLPQYLMGTPNFVNRISRGKDNATAAVFIDKEGK